MSRASKAPAGDAKAFEAASMEIRNLFEITKSQAQAAAAILDAARVLCALERAPEHHDTHPDHNIKTGGGFAHGLRLAAETLPAMLDHANDLVVSLLNDVDAMRECAIDAMNGDPQRKEADHV
jgi:hypothetical protein